MKHLLFLILVLLTSCNSIHSPEAPDGVTTFSKLNYIEVSWNDNSDDELGFIVYRVDEIVDTQAKVLAETPANTTSFKDFDVTSSINEDIPNYYRYMVVAKGEMANSILDANSSSSSSYASYYGDNVRGFSGFVEKYEGEQLLLKAYSFDEDEFNPSAPYVLLGGEGVLKESGDLEFEFKAGSNTEPNRFNPCNDLSNRVSGLFVSRLLLKNSLVNEPSEGVIVFASSKEAANRLVSNNLQENDLVGFWVYRLFSGTDAYDCDGNSGFFDLHSGWNTVLLTGLANNKLRYESRILPRELSWYFVKLIP